VAGSRLVRHSRPQHILYYAGVKFTHVQLSNIVMTELDPGRGQLTRTTRSNEAGARGQCGPGNSSDFPQPSEVVPNQKDCFSPSLGGNTTVAWHSTNTLVDHDEGGDDAQPTSRRTRAGEDGVVGETELKVIITVPDSQKNEISRTTRTAIRGIGDP
jgi:hypothetical protein